MLGDSLRRRKKRRPKRKKETPERAKPARREAGATPDWARWLGFAVGVVLASFLIGYALAVFVLFPVPATASAGLTVPDVVGLPLDEAEREIATVGLTTTDPMWLAAAVDSGRVIAQSPLPGQHLREGASVQLAVSTGPAPVRIPPVRGMDHEQARALLEELGFEVSRRQAVAALPEGRVVATQPEVGTALHPPAPVLLTVSAGPPPAAPVVPDTLPFRPIRSDGQAER